MCVESVDSVWGVGPAGSHYVHTKQGQSQAHRNMRCEVAYFHPHAPVLVVPPNVEVGVAVHDSRCRRQISRHELQQCGLACRKEGFGGGAEAGVKRVLCR